MKTGKQNETRIRFNNVNLILSAGVFQPRIETWFWTKKALENYVSPKLEKDLANRNPIRVLDIFAGSGCIGIFLLKNLERITIDFIDSSLKAVEQMKTNLKLNKIKEKRYRIFQSNLFGKIKGEEYDFIFANPPYVALSRISEVSQEVLSNDPKESLFAGKDGIFFIKRFLEGAGDYLKEDGEIFMEFDPCQRALIKKILQKQRLKPFFFKDQFEEYRWLRAIKHVKSLA